MSTAWEDVILNQVRKPSYNVTLRSHITCVSVLCFHSMWLKTALVRSGEAVFLCFSCAVHDASIVQKQKLGLPAESSSTEAFSRHVCDENVCLCKFGAFYHNSCWEKEPLSTESKAKHVSPYPDTEERLF